MKTLRLLLPAEDEMLEAAFFYEQQSGGLGQDFLRKVQSALDEIGRHPTRWPKVRGNIRRRLIHRFPYAVLYEGVMGDSHLFPGIIIGGCPC